MKKIAIIGRENVGKSTLFNKLCQKELSIVNNQPGVTRDYVKHIGKLYDLKFELIDTAGWYLKKKNEITPKIKTNTSLTIEEADFIFFVVDARTVLSEEDIILAKSIRKLQKNTVLLANKSESKKTLAEADLKKLGLGEGIFISAEHKLGFEDIYQAIKFDIQDETELVEGDTEEDAGNLSIAIIGRPNVGKSTLFNSILGFERSLVSDIAGTTRDYLLYEINTNGIIINLIDTAGVRRKSKVQEKIEELSITKTVEAIKASNIVLLLMDSENAFEKQDLILANLALRYNKLLVPIINKQDLIEDIEKFKDEVKYLTTKRLPQIKDISTIFISAQENFNHRYLFKKIINLWNLYNIKIPTSKLNNWLNDTLATYSLPIMKNNIKLKIKYVKQNSSCPPTFVFFINLSIKVEINKNFEKFLTNSLRAKFSLHGIPIKTHFVFSKNPFTL